MSDYNNPLDADSQATSEALLKRYGIKAPSAAQSALGAAGTAAGAAANTMASNRSAGIDAASQQEVLDQARRNGAFSQMLSREEDRRAGGSDARRAALQSAYPTSADRGVAGKYSRNVSAPKLDPAIEQSIRDEQNRRLSAGDSLLPQEPEYSKFAFDPELLKASKREKGLGLGSVAGSVAGAIFGSTWKKVGSTAAKILKFIFAVTLLVSAATV